MKALGAPDAVVAFGLSVLFVGVMMGLYSPYLLWGLALFVVGFLIAAATVLILLLDDEPRNLEPPEIIDPRSNEERASEMASEGGRP